MALPLPPSALRRIKRDLLSTMQKKNAVAVSRQFLDLLLAGDISGTVAVRALLLDDLTGTSAVRTCLDILYLTEEGLLGVDDLTFTVTFRAGNRRCTRLCACSVTFRTLILQCELDLFLAAKDCLFKCDPYAGS